MLSILIVNWNTCQMLRNCLQSIDDHPPEIPYEVIVVDNDSADQSAEMVESDFPQATLIKSGKNLGYAAGNNLAFNVAKGDFLLTLNPDTEIPAGTLQSAVETLQSHPECAALSVRFIGPDGETQPSVRDFPTLLNILGDFSGLARLFPESPLSNYRLPNFNYDTSQYAPQPMGTFLLFSRLALSKTTDVQSPFDEQFPIFFNEVDLLKRLENQGYKTWYQGTLSIFHHHGSSTRQVKKNMVWESHKSLVRYFAKHLKGIQRLALPIVALASYTAAFARARGYHAGFRP